MYGATARTGAVRSSVPVRCYFRKTRSSENLEPTSHLPRALPRRCAARCGSHPTGACGRGHPSRRYCIGDDPGRITMYTHQCGRPTGQTQQQCESPLMRPTQKILMGWSTCAQRNKRCAQAKRAAEKHGRLSAFLAPRVLAFYLLLFLWREVVFDVEAHADFLRRLAFDFVRNRLAR